MPILTDFQKAVAQFSDRRFLAVLVKALGLTLALFLAISLGFSWLLGLILPDQITVPFLGEITIFSSLLSFAAIPALMLLSTFLMFPVAAIFVGLFLDDVADAVDRRHYPALPKPRRLDLGEVLLDAARFAGLFLAVNAVALIIYVLSTVLAPVIFWLVNGFLIGREYFHQVACRRMPPTEAHRLRKDNWLRVWIAGVLMAVPLSIPFLNLIVPILGIATFTHQVERLRR